MSGGIHIHRLWQHSVVVYTLLVSFIINAMEGQEKASKEVAEPGQRQLLRRESVWVWWGVIFVACINQGVCLGK